MESKILNVCVTGAAGMIGYAFIPLLCTGQCFGPNVKINLKLLDIPQMEKVLQGVVLEIMDGAYPLVNSVETGSDPKAMFKDLDVGVFIGGFPRKQGMERKELLSINGKIFKEQGAALEAVANKDCKVLVVANPANTNCLILATNAPKIPKQNFTCMTRLDANRAQAQIAQKLNMAVSEIKNVIIWGNHSSTQYPDVNHGTAGGKPIREAVKDDNYLNAEFISKVQKRGAEVIAARGGSSVFSAANAAKDHLHDWFFGSENIVSMGIYTDGTQYGIQKDLLYSFPIKCKGNFQYEVVSGLTVDTFSRQKMDDTAKELTEEKAEAFA